MSSNANQELLQELAHARQQEAAARRTSEALVRCLGTLAIAVDPSAVFDRLLPELSASLDADSAFVLEPAGDGLVVTASSHAARLGMRWPLTGLFRAQDDRCSVAVVCEVSLMPGWADGTSAVPTASALLLRIGSGDRPAVLVCGSARSGHFQSTHLDLARSIAPIVSQVLLRAEEHRRLRLETTERARVEAELKHQQTAMLHMQKMEAVAQLAAGMAHEINTPLQYASDNLRFLTTALAAISGAIPTLTAWLEPHMDKAVLRQFLDMADIDYLTAEAPKAAEQCREGVDRVASIVLSLKRFAATDAGSAEPADINDAVRTTLAVCTAELRESADLQLELGELSPVPCRVAEIRQVLYSLLLNAVRAINDRPHGGRGTIAITTRALPGAVEITVADDGCGMDAETLRRACEPFFTTRTVGHGSGQGLAIAHEVARSHGGELVLTSIADQGTRVRLILPLVPPTVAEKAQANQSKTKS